MIPPKTGRHPAIATIVCDINAELARENSLARFTVAELACLVDQGMAITEFHRELNRRATVSTGSE